MPRRHRKDGHSTVSNSTAEDRHKGKGHGKITPGRNYWKLLIRYRQKLSMDVPRSRSFDHTDKKRPFLERCYKDLTIIPVLLVGEGVQVLQLLPPPLSLIDQNLHALWCTPNWKTHVVLHPHIFQEFI